MKILIVMSSVAYLKDIPTGVWMEDFTFIYYRFDHPNIEIEFASIKGGPVPIDSRSVAAPFLTNTTKQFMNDATAIEKLSHTTPISDIDFENDGYDVLFLVGGFGSQIDFVNSTALQKGIETMYRNKKIVAAICLGVAGLTSCVDSNGTPLVKGLEVTGFSSSEADATMLSSVLPFSLETKLKDLGANYSKTKDWRSKVCVDGNLITGQNPQSSEEITDIIAEHFGLEKETGCNCNIM